MFQTRAASQQLGLWTEAETCVEPEQRLMLAVLEEALTTFVRGLNSSVAAHRKELHKVEEWVRSTDVDWPFSFENVCVTLGIDADYVRSKLGAIRRGAFASRIAPRNRKVRRERIRSRQVWRGHIG